MFFYSFPIIKMSFFLSYNLISFMPFPCYKKTVPFPDYFLNRIFYSTEGIIRYLGRYRARSPVAEYKITEIDDGKVTFFFNDLANNKKKTYITMPAEKFISQILIHLPPKNFKMVNRYGFYSRHISDELKKAMEPFRKNIAVSKYSFYQRQMYITFGMNPFYCPECKVKMIVWEFYHYLYPPLKKYY